MRMCVRKICLRRINALINAKNGLHYPVALKMKVKKTFHGVKILRYVCDFCLFFGEVHIDKNAFVFFINKQTRVWSVHHSSMLVK